MTFINCIWFIFQYVSFLFLCFVLLLISFPLQYLFPSSCPASHPAAPHHPKFIVFSMLSAAILFSILLPKIEGVASLLWLHSSPVQGQSIWLSTLYTAVSVHCMFWLLWESEERLKDKTMVWFLGPMIQLKELEKDKRAFPAVPH